MNRSQQLVMFALEALRLALRLDEVERVFAALSVTALPGAPAIVHGVVNLRGQIVPVVNLRRRFHLPERGMRLNDCLLVARTTRRIVALAVDRVSGVVECPEGDIVAAAQVVPGLEHVAGIAKLRDGLILIQHLDRVLSLEEERVLAVALNAEPAHP